MRRRLANLPLWVTNLITVIGGLISIATFINMVFSYITERVSPSTTIIATYVVLVVFSVIILLKLKRNRDLSNKLKEITADNYHRLLRSTRDTYFDVVSSRKANEQLNADQLTDKYKSELKSILGNLCEIMNAYTGQKISACVKKICYKDEDETITNDTTVITFCRSESSTTERGEYEQRREILIKDNTDFSILVFPRNGRCPEYFYQGDLEKYDKQLKMKKDYDSYRNTDEDWREHYIGTIVVPIRVGYSRLYEKKQDKGYHIIGFLCIDSLSRDAFIESQEKSNVAVVKAFADIICVLLFQYLEALKESEMIKT